MHTSESTEHTLLVSGFAHFSLIPGRVTSAVACVGTSSEGWVILLWSWTQLSSPVTSWWTFDCMNDAVVSRGTVLVRGVCPVLVLEGILLGMN